MINKVEIYLVILGMAGLLVAADFFVSQAAAMARKFRVNDFVIGFTVVAVGTSLPELITSVISSFTGHPSLAISNIIGSNLANLCLILGITSVFRKFKINRQDVVYNIPLNLASLIVFWILMGLSNVQLNRFAGIGLLFFFLVLNLAEKNKGDRANKVTGKIAKFNPAILIGSLILMMLAGKITVENIVRLISIFNIRESILGYFVLSIGTSLPEMVTTFVAVRKNNSEIGIGSLLGSNLFNLLFILGVVGVFSPTDASGFLFDLAFLAAATIMVYFFALRGEKYNFTHKEGLGLLGIYFLFVVKQLVLNGGFGI